MNIKLYISGSEVTLNKGSYTLSFINKQTTNETEAGTIIRDIKRLGIPHLAINMPANESEYSAFYTAYLSNASVKVKYYNPATKTLTEFDGFLENFSSELVVEVLEGLGDTEWNLSFEITSH